MATEEEDDDARHRREEAERRAKRKAAKSSKSKTSEKDRKRREHAQRVLNQQAKKPRLEKAPAEPEATGSKFEALFAQRSHGFVMDFAFRNAPPRPPVGPCFVGLGLDGQLQECSQYHPTVELNYTWKLHSESDLGVPLAPSAMDASCYQENKTHASKLHPEDDALLNWTGSLGDTAAEELKLKRDQARAAARLALKGKAPPPTITPAAQPKKKKAFSRVLDENMQSWMKRTTYLSNDYSRKVHDFVSLAKTKQRTEQELQALQAQIVQSADTVDMSFTQTPIVKHPSKPNLKPVMEVPLLPNAQHWGHAYTHVVLDNAPKGETDIEKPLNNAFVAHVEKKQASARMTCQLLVPKEEDSQYRPMQQYDLDVVPLKDEDGPHVHFAIWIGNGEATYLPISSRVLLSTGRPVKRQATTVISRRPASQEERLAWLERTSEVDADVAQEFAQQEVEASNEAANTEPASSEAANSEPATAEASSGSTPASSYNPMQVDESSGDEQEGTFGASAPIVAEG